MFQMEQKDNEMIWNSSSGFYLLYELNPIRGTFSM